MPRRVKTAAILVLLAVLVAFVTVVAIGWATAWRRLPHYEPREIALPPIMDNDAYGLVIDEHERPYVYEISSEGGAVLVFGAEHTRDPNDPQIADITRRYRAFGPTVVLCESRLGVMFPQLMDPVETFGEVGIVHRLARRSGAVSYTWEPRSDVLVRSLFDQGFTREQAGLYFALRSYFSNLRHARPSDPEAFVADTLTERMRWEGLDRVFETVGDVQSAWDEAFPEGPDWRDVSDEHALPGFLSRIDLNIVRDEHLVRTVVDLVGQGERVFVICGSSHAVKIENALGSLLE